MKNIFSIAAICLLMIGCAPSRTAVSVQYTEESPAVGYEVFYNELSPYGRWIEYPQYGYVWVPTVEAGFRPYATNGHWVYTDYGWTWASNYQWGWAAFHYGRWMYEDGYGWMWMPGHEWAPAWVMWGRSGGYYGWAPLAPHVSVSVSAGWTPPAHYWNFVPAEHITQVNINNYVVNKTTNVTVVNNITKNVTIINNTNIHNTTVNNTTNNYYAGPPREDVEKATNQHLTEMKLAPTNKLGQTTATKDQLMMYRPVVKENASTEKPAPKKFEAYQQSKPIPRNTNDIKNLNPESNNMNAGNVNNNSHRNNAITNDNAPIEKNNPVDQKSNSFAPDNQLWKENNQAVNNKPGNNNPDSKRLNQQPVQSNKVAVNNNSQKQNWRQRNQQNNKPPKQNKKQKNKDKRKDE